MQQRADQLHLHAFAQRQLANRLPGQLRDAEQLGQLAECLLELLARQRVDLTMKLERVGRGKVPPELILLPHDERELPAEGVVAVPGHEAEHAGATPGWVDEA